ncbi:MAG: HPr family phosphocarrier protein [Spirochaeta sp.]|jgi:phosphocarrier protein HPr|nr:HPr family phosphocarrier protein [Spirochaeta sp.]
MLQELLTVTNPKGIHARPSAMIVDTAQKLDATIRFLADGEVIDATNIMDVLSMGAACGAEITVTVDGGDEASAMQRMKEIFASNFGDD